MPKFIDNSKQLKIWFNTSGNPDAWMPEINQLRLIEFREKNPDKQINLLIDKSKLSEKALKEIEAFSKEFNITILDIEDFAEELEHPDDKALIELAKQELNSPIGNPAAARDIVTMIPHLIVKYGHYSDLDCPISIPKESHTPVADDCPPLLIPFVQEGEKAGSWRVNNDVLVVVREEGESDAELEQRLREGQLGQAQTFVMQQFQNPSKPFDLARALTFYQPGMPRPRTVDEQVDFCMDDAPPSKDGLFALRIAFHDKYLKLPKDPKPGDKSKPALKHRAGLEKIRCHFNAAWIRDCIQKGYFSRGLEMHRPSELHSYSIKTFLPGEHYCSGQIPFHTSIVEEGHIERAPEFEGFMGGDASWNPTKAEGLKERDAHRLEALRARYGAAREHALGHDMPDDAAIAAPPANPT